MPNRYAVVPDPRDPWQPFDWRSARQTIPGRVRALALADPQRPALLDPGGALDRGDLDRAANRVANALLARRGAAPEAVVLLLDVDATAVVAALGVGKAGKHFVGVEPTFPAWRIKQIAADAQAAVVVTRATHLALARQAARDGTMVVDLDALDGIGDAAPDADVSPDAICLLNYTSGSTGTPKGVVQTHRSAIAQACRYANAFRAGEADLMTSFGSLAWAGSFWDVFGPLCLGASAGLYDVRRHGMHGLGPWLAATGATVVSGMTVARRLAFDFPALRLPAVRLVQLGGDTVYRRDVEACQRTFPNAVIAVGMGLSEAGRIAQQFIVPGQRLARDVVPVGFPTAGVDIALVGDDGRAVASGEIGEIVAMSDEHAAGYWNLPELTAERFRPVPDSGGKLRYFTGDLGRVLPDGMLLHVGRKDFQIKVQGYAVAANEIEAKLLAQDGVRECCVVARQSAAGVDGLVAYLVRDAHGALAAADLRERLRAELPDYMVPRRFVDLDALPRTPTGKIDRIRLPEAPVANRDLATAYVAPARPFEAELAAIWEDVLDVDVVGVDDDFVALGGDSLGAARIANRVILAFGIDLALGTLLARPTVAAMAALLASAGSGDAARPAALTSRRGR